MDQLAQAQKTIQAALLKGERITVAQGNRIARTTETRKIISRLRRKGMDIRDEWMENEGRRFKQYWNNVN